MPFHNYKQTKKEMQITQNNTLHDIPYVALWHYHTCVFLPVTYVNGKYTTTLLKLTVYKCIQNNIATWLPVAFTTIDLD